MDDCCCRQFEHTALDPSSIEKRFGSVTTASMSFEIAPLKEDEIDVYIKTSWEALTSTEDSLLTLIYPDGYTESVQSNMRKTTRDGFSDPSTSYILIRDSSTKNVVAVACWYYQTEDLTIQEMLDMEEKAKQKREEQGPVTGVNDAMITMFREAAMKNKRETLAGKAHAALRVLSTLPAAQRKGAGTAGLIWGLRKADELELPAYLVSSSMAKSLYAKHGFNEVGAAFDSTLNWADVESCQVGELSWDTSHHGYPRKVTHSCMLRAAKRLG
jgi:hypothetical protein